jgi:hypothetical protein
MSGASRAGTLGARQLPRRTRLGAVLKVPDALFGSALGDARTEDAMRSDVANCMSMCVVIL